MDTGESAQISRNTIAQGMSMFRLHLWRLTRVLSFTAREAVGAVEHPAFPAPSFSSRCVISSKLGRNAPRECGFMPHQRHCEERSDEAIQTLDWLWIASLSLAMTMALFEIRIRNEASPRKREREKRPSSAASRPAARRSRSSSIAECWNQGRRGAACP